MANALSDWVKVQLRCSCDAERSSSLDLLLSFSLRLHASHWELAIPGRFKTLCISFCWIPFKTFAFSMANPIQVHVRKPSRALERQQPGSIPGTPRLISPLALKCQVNQLGPFKTGAIEALPHVVNLRMSQVKPCDVPRRNSAATWYTLRCSRGPWRCGLGMIGPPLYH